ncbi:hypothetical protein DFH06DRAFT_1128928 [Mycena polygramma]|nr:hypothetical protein DFH06DRAFT_1128928 [Mycena polygramma]
MKCGAGYKIESVSRDEGAYRDLFHLNGGWTLNLSETGVLRAGKAQREMKKRRIELKQLTRDGAHAAASVSVTPVESRFAQMSGERRVEEKKARREGAGNAKARRNGQEKLQNIETRQQSQRQGQTRKTVKRERARHGQTGGTNKGCGKARVQTGKGEGTEGWVQREKGGGDHKGMTRRRRRSWGRSAAAWSVTEGEMKQRNERQGDTHHQYTIAALGRDLRFVVSYRAHGVYRGAVNGFEWYWWVKLDGSDAERTRRWWREEKHEMSRVTVTHKHE